MKKLIILILLLLTAGSTLTAQSWFTPNGATITPQAYSCFAVNPLDGKLYAIHRNDSYNNQATVVYFNDNSWITMSANGIPADQADYAQIAFDAFGTPYISFVDSWDGNKTYVMKFNGTTWVNVGTPGFTSNADYKPKLRFDYSTNTPYYAYMDGTNYHINVMKFNGTNGILSVPQISMPVLLIYGFAIDRNGALYVVYDNPVSPKKTTVKKFNGTSWVALGAATGFSQGNAEYQTIALDSTGNVYVAYAIIKKRQMQCYEIQRYDLELCRNSRIYIRLCRLSIACIQS